MVGEHALQITSQPSYICPLKLKLDDNTYCIVEYFVGANEFFFFVL